LSIRNAVKDYQRRLADLDAAHSRARSRLEAARRRRDALIAEQDRLVAEAERAVEDSAADMAAEVGPELAAKLLDLKPTQLRQLLRHRVHSDARGPDQATMEQ
jgi:flagellar motility protein MotE (MotC chaperone)